MVMLAMLVILVILMMMMVMPKEGDEDRMLPRGSGERKVRRGNGRQQGRKEGRGREWGLHVLSALVGPSQVSGEGAE